MPIDISQAAQLWAANAPSAQASQKYQMKTAGKGNYQKSQSLAAEPTFQAAMQRVIGSGSRAAGVQRQDPSKYERNIAAKGVQNRIQGIQAAGPGAWQAGFSPFAGIIDSTTAGYGPKSADAAENVTRRVLPLAVALQNAKRGGAGAGITTAPTAGAYMGGAGY